METINKWFGYLTTCPLGKQWYCWAILTVGVVGLVLILT